MRDKKETKKGISILAEEEGYKKRTETIFRRFEKQKTQAQRDREARNIGYDKS